MATIRLIPSTYELSSTQYLSISNANNMYANTDSTTYATITNSQNGTSSYYIYVRGFNFNDIPNNAIINSFTVKLKAYQSGITTSSSYKPYLANGTNAINGSCDSIGTTATVYTFTGLSADWDDIISYGSNGSNFGIRINCRRASRNTTGYMYIYGAEIEVDYTIPVYHNVSVPYTMPVYHNVSVSVETDKVTSVSPATTQTIAEGNDYELHIISSNTPGDNFKVEDNNVEVTNQLVAHYPETSGNTVLGEYSLVSGSFYTGESYFQGLVGKGVNNTQTTSNYYSSGVAVFTYKLEFSNIPSNATITNLYVQVNGHAKSTSDSSEYMCVQIMTGSTALSDEFNFKSAGTSNTTQTINATTLPTVSQLSDLKLQCRLGYCGGAINGATAYIEYDIPSSSSDPDYYIYTIESIVADHAIVISNSIIEIPEEDPQKTYYPITISGINCTTTPSKGTNRVEAGTSQTITIYPTESQVTLITDNGVDVSSQLVQHGGGTGTYTVNSVSGASYGFNLNNSTGYYTSNNNGKANSAAVCRVMFNLPVRSLITIEYINYAEAAYDYGIFGNIDTALRTTYSADSNAYKVCSQRTDNRSSVQTLTYEISAGEHFIDIKYRKDSSKNSNNDNLQFKISSIQELEINNYYTYTLSNINQEHSLIFIFGNVTYYFVNSSVNGEAILYPNGSMVALPGDDYKLTIVPKVDNGTLMLTDNNVDRTSQVQTKTITITKEGQQVTITNYIYSLSNVQATHNISVTYSTQSTYEIRQVNNSLDLTISPSGTQEVDAGDNYTVSITTSKPGTITVTDSISGTTTYNISLSDVSGGSKTVTHTLTNIRASKTLTFDFTELTKYNVTASENSTYLSIPSGYASQSVYSGQSCDVKFTSTTPGTITVSDNGTDTNYTVSSLNQTITHTISSVTAAHTVTATFTIATYLVSASSSITGVTFTPASQTIDYDESATITIKSTNPGTVVITDNGTDSSYVINVANGKNTHTISSVTAAHTITVKSFTLATYTVTATKGSGVTSVSPVSQSLDYGSNVSLNVTPTVPGTLTIKETNLPYDAEIEYIKSTGTQRIFIDNYIVNPNTEYYLTLKFDNIASNWSSSNKNVYAAINTGGDTNCAFSVNFGGSTNQLTTLFWWTNKTYQSGSSVKSKDYSSTILSNKNTIHYTNGNINYGGTNFAVLTKTTTNGQGLALFGSQGASFSAYNMYVYNFKLIENSIIIHDYIPVRIGTEGYLYDKVSGRLFGNLGTGNFTLGPDVDTSGTLTIYEQEISSSEAGTAITCSNIYTNLSANHSVTASVLGLDQHTITVTNNSPSILSYTPSSPISIYDGDTLTINFVPTQPGTLTVTDSVSSSNNQTYTITSSDINVAKVYTIANVTADRTITANLTIASYTVSASSSVTGVTLTPASQTITHGSSCNVTITSASPGTVVITDNGTDSSYTINDANGTATHTISSVNAAHNITVKSFTLVKYTVTATKGSGVTSISPTSQSLYYGSNVSLNVTPTVPGTLYIKETNLPYDAEIEYLESTGTQYIDLGIIPDANTGAYANVVCSDNTDIYFFGLRNDSGNTRWGAGHSSGGFYYCYGNYGSTIRLTGYSAEIYLNYLNDGNYISTNGTTTKQGALPSLPFTPALNIYLFGCAYINTINKWKGKFYSFKLTQGSDIVIDMIPVRVGTVGYMYDKVSGQLFGNSGTGNFTLGPDVDTSGILTIYSTDIAVGQQGISKTCSNIYTNLSVNHSVIASVDELTKYNVSVTNNSSTYLTVTPSSTQSIYSGQNATIQIKTTKAGTVSITDNVTGNTSYLEYSNSELNTNKSFTLENVTSAHTLTISLAAQTYQVSVSTSSEYITITSQTPVNIADGSNYQVTANASIPGTVTLKEGNTTINSANVTSPNGTYSYNVTNITSQRTFTLLFTPTNYTVSASVSSGSDVTIISGASYSGIYGTEYVLTFRLGSIGTVSVNDSGTVTTYIIGPDEVNQTQTYQKTVTGNSTITLSNSIDTYDITGTIASGSTTYLKYVDNGTDKTLISKTVNAGSNYVLNIKSTHPGTLSLTINGETSNITLSDSYTYPYTYSHEISNILNDVIISSSFTVLTFDIQDNGSTIDNIVYGQSYTYTFTPTVAGTYKLYDNDSLIETYNITASQVGIAKSYTINRVTSPHNFSVSSTVQTYSINVTNNAQKYISNINVSNRNPEYNGSSVITIYPRLKGTINITDNNGTPTTISTTGVQKTYTLQNITDNHTIVITFTPGTYVTTLTNNIPSTYNYTLSKNSGNYNVTGCETFSFTLSANQTENSKTTMNGKVIVARTIGGSTIRKTYSIIKDTPFSTTYSVEDIVNDMTITLTFEETQEAPANGDRFLKPFNNDSEAQTYITNNNPNPFISYRRNSKTVDYTSHLGNMRMTTQIYRGGNGHKLFERD